MLHVDTFTFLPQAFAENTYLLRDDSGKCVIVDPGCYLTSEQQQLVHHIEKHGLEPEAIWLTHAHLDHVFGVNFLKRKYNIPIYSHRLEQDNFDYGPERAALFGFSMEPLEQPDFYMEEGDKIRFGNTELSVIFTPGHSPGHVSFYHADSGQLFSGDVIFRGSFGRVDLPGGSLDVLRDTIKSKILTLPEETKIYAGHMGTTTVEREKLSNPMVHGF